MSDALALLRARAADLRARLKRIRRDAGQLARDKEDIETRLELLLRQARELEVKLEEVAQLEEKLSLGSASAVNENVNVESESVKGRVLNALETLGPKGGRLVDVYSAARQSGVIVNRSSTNRYLVTLAAAGLVRRLPGGRYIHSRWPDEESLDEAVSTSTQEPRRNQPAQYWREG